MPLHVQGAIVCTSPSYRLHHRPGNCTVLERFHAMSSLSPESDFAES